MGEETIPATETLGLRPSLAASHGGALAETECLFIPLQAMFHFRLELAKKMHLKLLILCSLPVRDIFACHRVAIAPQIAY